MIEQIVNEAFTAAKQAEAEYKAQHGERMWP